MQIKIAERLRPYSHRPGITFILPGSSLSMQVFPTLIRVADLKNVSVEEIKLNNEGPLKDFTVQQDLEKGCLRIWGNGPSGFIRYRFHAVKDRFIIKMEKGHDKLGPLAEGNSVYSPRSTDRLSLGMSKQQDWTMLSRRQDLAEIFPLWHRLGQLIPQIESEPVKYRTLLGECRQAIQEATPDIVLDPFMNLFLAGFKEGLTPRLRDEDFHGFSLPVCSSATPLVLLSEGAKMIRSLFVQWEDENISILPLLPSQFHCGRLIQVETGWGTLDLEWTKKKVRRMIFRAEKTGRLNFHFKKVKKYRLRHGNKDRGQFLKAGDFIEIQAGQIYWFDNFEQ